ncbi:hypothetical protein CHS0354_000608 [Potamilus streckersoni]|uniref:arginine--tRNA ligase n=1 Tax=Potamilus streckersoni TaxID=2493646 RepID=A0AAE0T707_9BIVA|nr:hypothetical protein CHS0354_000608 [Potamilus streckersoni]
MKVSILTVGDELLTGHVVNTNTAFIGETLHYMGADVKRMVSVGDDEQEIKNEVAYLLQAQKSDVVIVTGGLGPTHDDVTKNAVASLLKRALIENNEAMERCRLFFEKRGKPMPEINRSQGMVIEGCKVLQNELGTALGMFIENVFNCQIVILLPGVPSEMRELLTKQVQPLLRPLVKAAVQESILMTSGAGESLLAEQIGNPSSFLGEKTKLAFLPNTSSGVKLRITTIDRECVGNIDLVKQENERVKNILLSKIKSFVYSESDQIQLENVVGQLLMERRLKLAVAESCTGGLVSNRLTNVAGSSNYFIHGSVIYSNEAKQRLGVKSETLDAFGAVSEEVAIELAKCIRHTNACDVGVGITGIAGPGGGSEKKPVGLVWIAVAFGGALKSSSLKEKYDAKEMEKVRVDLEIPNEEKFGDFSSNVAMFLAKVLKKSPILIAEEVKSVLLQNKELDKKVSDIKIAGNGFLNFYLSPHCLVDCIYMILEEKDHYGHIKNSEKKTALVEYVSANPTGPLTVGRGRGGVLGDTLANILETQGYHVTREYYFNNAGRQMYILGDSVRLRYMELIGEGQDFPEDYYQGTYIRNIALAIFNEHGNTKKDENVIPFFKEYAEHKIFSEIKKTLLRIGIKHDSFFNELELYQINKQKGTKPIEDVVMALRNKGYIEERDGATWFLTTKCGFEKDKALIKSTGEPTYRLPDIAYHVTKFDRGFDLILNVFGTDHIDEYPDVVTALNILGYDVSKIKVAINQFVTVTIDGKVVKMSTRKGNAELLDDLIEDVGADATRFFFIMRSKDSHLNFDLKLAKEQSAKNPVFYLHYAYTRVCSILSLAGDLDESRKVGGLFIFTTEEEKRLIKVLMRYPDVLTFSAELLEPQKLATYLLIVAESFHKFYENCRVIGEEIQIMNSRVCLCQATRNVIKNGLNVLGLSIIERM